MTANTGGLRMVLLSFLQRHRTFLADISAMMSGKTISAAIALFTMPIVARLFQPSDFGVAASFMSIVAVVSHIGSLRYERAIVLPEDDGEAAILMSLTYRILICVSLFSLLTIAALEAAAIDLSVLNILGTWKWLLPLGIFLVAGLQIQEAWITRQGGFRLLASSTVLGSIVNSSVRIGSGTIWGTSIAGLISSNLIGVLSRIVLQRSMGVDGLSSVFHRYSFESLKARALSYIDFPKLDAPAGLIFSLGQNLPVLMFGVMFSPAVAGFYAMANRLAQAPVTIVASSTRRVFLQKAARIKNQGRSLLKAYLLTTGGLFCIGVIPFAIVFLLGQPLLGWLLGDDWLDAGRLLEIMAPWLLMTWVSAPTNPVFVVLRKQNVWLLLQSTLTIFRLSAFGIAYLMALGPERTLGAFVAATVIGNLVTIAMALRVITSASTARSHVGED